VRAARRTEVELTHRFRIHGRVQGVGFRAFVYREARSLHIEGWVRNRFDGTVEALAWGDETAIDRLLHRIEEGPRWGRVDRVDVTVESGEQHRPGGFDILADR
jgi:acylphosphatase